MIVSLFKYIDILNGRKLLNKTAERLVNAAILESTIATVIYDIADKTVLKLHAKTVNPEKTQTAEKN